MDDYKGFIIFGDGDKDGEVVTFGNSRSDDLHIAGLLDFSNKYYPDDPILSRLNIRHSPEVVAYFISVMNNIVFLNLTKYDGANVSKYGKSGLIMLPDNVTEKQLESLKEIAKNLESYDLIIKADLKINEGFLESKTLACMNKLSSEELIKTIRNNTTIQENKPIGY